jgi:alpha-tubulin suppressor-like RCC1 family protein
VKTFLSLIFIFISSLIFAEDFNCSPDTLLIDFTPSISKERIQLCQIKIDGKFLKHGPEIIYNKDGTIKSRKFYKMDIESKPDNILKDEPIKEKVSSKDKIVSSFTTTCALIKGAVKCWGGNLNALGNEKGVIGDKGIKVIPIQIPGLESNVTDIAMNNFYACVVINNGVKCWGHGCWGGDCLAGFSKGYTSLKNIAELQDGVKSISAGEEFACALLKMGAVKCWGKNSDGQLGNGSFKDSIIPIQVSGLDKGVTSIATGRWHSCALLENGNVKCWGHNDQGELGDGTNIKKNIPTQVLGLSAEVSDLAVSDLHNCILSKNQVQCWGDNTSGALGDGTTKNRNTPTPVNGITFEVKGMATGSSSTCVWSTSGRLACWGGIDTCDGDKQFIKKSPTSITGLSFGIANITMENQSCALLLKGGAMCWGGDNSYGQLGDGSTLKRLSPVMVFGL